MSELVKNSRVDVDIDPDPVEIQPEDPEPDPENPGTGVSAAGGSAKGAADTAMWANPCPRDDRGQFGVCRAYDARAPYLAGSRLTNCTMGFGVFLPDGQQREMTAAHCGVLHSARRQDDGSKAGEVVARDPVSDVALTTTPMAPYVWTGDSKSTTAKAVVS
ncbi:hypothetical protein, partial [Streptomyces sp. H51]|uniref:hypothetical protein n=1 Tax=Streptomyces sp. H51 TaxID=3111770 RepID=UPI002D785F67